MTNNARKTYTVHISREMRLTYEGIQADNPEEAALEAKNGREGNAFEVDEDWQGEAFSAVVVEEDHEEDERLPVITFEADHRRKATPSLLAACRLVIERWERGDLAEAARACSTAIAEAENAHPLSSTDPAKKPYSVLLLYPDDVNDSGTETYYTFVEAPDAIEAVAVARREAVAAQVEAAADYEPDDFAPLLVIAGHHYAQPMSNQ